MVDPHRQFIPFFQRWNKTQSIQRCRKISVRDGLAFNRILIDSKPKLNLSLLYYWNVRASHVRFLPSGFL
jgi:hypothetical protein